MWRGKGIRGIGVGQLGTPYPFGPIYSRYDTRRVAVKTKSKDTQPFFGEVDLIVFVQNVFPGSFKREKDSVINEINRLQNVVIVPKSRFNNIISHKARCGITKETNIDESYFANNLDLVGGPRDLKRVKAITTHPFFAFCPNNDTVWSSNEHEGGSVPDSLAVTISRKAYKANQDTFCIRYYSVWQPWGIGTIVKKDLIAGTMYQVDNIDCDVSEDGKTWYHLFDSAPCQNGFPFLHITNVQEGRVNINTRARETESTERNAENISGRNRK